MATTTTPASEVTMVTCPGLCGPTGAPACGGEQVAAHGLADFDAATVSVDPCSKLLAQGWTGPQEVLRKTQAIERLTAPAEPVGYQHRDGLVIFAGAI